MQPSPKYSLGMSQRFFSFIVSGSNIFTLLCPFNPVDSYNTQEINPSMKVFEVESRARFYSAARFYEAIFSSFSFSCILFLQKLSKIDSVFLKNFFTDFFTARGRSRHALACRYYIFSKIPVIKIILMNWPHSAARLEFW